MGLGVFGEKGSEMGVAGIDLIGKAEGCERSAKVGVGLVWFGKVEREPTAMRRNLRKVSQDA